MIIISALSAARRHLKWWINSTQHHMSHPILPPNLEMTLETYTFRKRRGGVSCNCRVTTGAFEHHRSGVHINWFELKAVCIPSFADLYKQLPYSDAPD